MKVWFQGLVCAKRSKSSQESWWWTTGIHQSLVVGQPKVDVCLDFGLRPRALDPTTPREGPVLFHPGGGPFCFRHVLREVDWKEVQGHAQLRLMWGRGLRHLTFHSFEASQGSGNSRSPSATRELWPPG